MNREIQEIDEEIKEKVILVAVDLEKENVNECLDELEELAATAGALTVDKMIQKREQVHPSHYIGKGKIEEVKQRVIETQATGIICDDELSPAQLKNLEKLLDIKVMDRTMLILDIFAQRAQSKEGKVQVELAQLQYRLSRLVGLGTSLSRLGGGIGTRGPGEKKLEMDRRHIRRRIGQLKNELQELESHRNLIRSRRQKVGTPLAAIVGYTNAGKSTLLNALTEAGVLAEDKLFATLDPTTRGVTLPGGSEVLLTDTVGFIRKLPHHLIQAFHSTLEEVQYADIVIHLVDGSSEQIDVHKEVVYQTLEKLKVIGKPIITVYNKIDKPIDHPLPIDEKAEKTVQISAKTGRGIQYFLYAIEEILQARRKKIAVLIPYTDGKMVQMIHGQGEILKEEHLENGTYIEVYLEEEIFHKIGKYEVKR